MRKFDSPEREQISLDLILFSSLTRPVVMRINTLVITSTPPDQVASRSSGMPMVGHPGLREKK